MMLISCGMPIADASAPRRWTFSWRADAGETGRRVLVCADKMRGQVARERRRYRSIRRASHRGSSPECHHGEAARWRGPPPAVIAVADGAGDGYREAVAGMTLPCRIMRLPRRPHLRIAPSAPRRR